MPGRRRPPRARARGPEPPWARDEGLYTSQARRRLQELNPAQLGLFAPPTEAAGIPRPAWLETAGDCQVPAREERSWIYDEPPGCATQGDGKREARQAMHAAWVNGFRPQVPPRPYNPEPPGTPPQLYTVWKETKKHGRVKERDVKRPDLAYDPNLRTYDKIIVHFSSGKDSVACLLYVIELLTACGLDPAERIECWHQCVDGNPHPLLPDGSPAPKQHVWDWPITEAYLVAICNHLGVPLLFQWREGGITGGVFLKKGEPPRPVYFEHPSEGVLVTQRGVDPPPGYEVVKVPGVGEKPREKPRLQWPKLGKIHQGRWCSSYVKIEVGNSVFRSSARFDGMRVLMISGERAEESSNRATYVHREFNDKAGHDTKPKGKGRLKVKRYVENWRPVLKWCEIEVWAIFARWKLTPHPAYLLGFGRLSCLTCIFSSKSQLETIRSALGPAGGARFNAFVRAEDKVGRAQQRAVERGSFTSDEAKKLIPTIKSYSEKAGRKKLTRPLPLADFVDTVMVKDRMSPDEVDRYADTLTEGVRAGAIAPELAEEQVERAAAGLASAYPAALLDPALAEVSMSQYLPEGWSMVLPQWDDPSFLPAGAFGENDGPT